MRDRLLDDLFVLLAEVDSADLQVLKRGGIAKSGINRLRAVINASPVAPASFPRLKQDRLVRFVLHLLFELNLLVVRPHETVAGLSDDCDNWLSAPLEAQQQRLFSAYLGSSWDELYQIPSLRIDVSGRRNPPKECRRAVLSELARLPEGEWQEFGAFSMQMSETLPDFLRPQSDPYNWRITILDAGKGHRFHSEDGERSFWFNLEGHLLANYIYDPLYWLGAVKLRLSKKQQLTHFAISEIGKRLLNGDLGSKPDKPQKHFVLQPDFEITANREFDRSALLFLNQFSNRGETDAVFRFQLTKHSIARALQRGINSKSIISFLKRHSLGGVPQNVEFSIREWAAKFGNIRIRDAVLLETADEFLMTEILNLHKIATYIQEQIGERTALIDGTQANALYKLLKREGYLPEIDEELVESSPELQTYSLSQQQSTAVFASALALSRILRSVEHELPALKRLCIDEELLSAKLPFLMELQVRFLAGELSDLVIQRESISRRLSDGKKARLPNRPRKGIIDSLSTAMTLAKPVVVEYISPITQAVQYKKVTVSEVIQTQNGGYIRAIDQTTGDETVISLLAIRSASSPQ